MSVDPLDGPWIPADHYRSNRSRQKWGRVVFLGTHTAEGGSSAKALGEYFQRTDRDVSSHCGIGQGGEYAEYVRYSHTAFTMPPVNDDSENCELLGFAAWSRSEWLDHAKMLNTFAHWLAWRSEVRNIPLRVLTASEAKAGKAGILMHRTATEAWHVSNHTDPGTHFPWDLVLAKARDIREDDMPTAKEVVAELLKPANLDKIADAVLNRDTIRNSFTGNPDNETVTPATALAVLGDRSKPTP